MIRAIAQNDRSAINDLVVAAELFPADEVEIVDGLVNEYFERNAAVGHRCVVEEEGGQLTGVAYYQPKQATDGAWEVLMLGVRANQQRSGLGSALMRHVENQLREDGQRLILVETSSTPDFDRARAFYTKLGYEEEARVRDYYADGDNMVLFRKRL